MSNRQIMRALVAAGLVAGGMHAAHAATFIPNNPALPDIRITEFMYKNEDGSDAEFVQFTNMGTTAVNMSGWSEDDATAKPGVHVLSGLGTLAPGQSGILAEESASAFESDWSLPANTPYVVENGSDNLGNGDTIYLFDAAGDIVDEVNYGVSGSPKSDGIAAVPKNASVIGTNNGAGWQLISVGVQGGHVDAAGHDIADPGYSAFAPTSVPLPAAGWLLMSGLGVVAPALRRRVSKAA